MIIEECRHIREHDAEAIGQAVVLVVLIDAPPPTSSHAHWFGRAVNVCMSCQASLEYVTRRITGERRTGMKPP